MENGEWRLKNEEWSGDWRMERGESSLAQWAMPHGPCHNAIIHALASTPCYFFPGRRFRNVSRIPKILKKVDGFRPIPHRPEAFRDASKCFKLLKMSKILEAF